MAMDPKLEKTSAGFYALAALRVYDRAFGDRTPYKITAAVIGEHDVDADDLAWLDAEITKLDESIALLSLAKGDIVGARHALQAVKLCSAEAVNAQEVYNEASRAEAAIKGIDQ